MNTFQRKIVAASNAFRQDPYFGLADEIDFVGLQPIDDVLNIVRKNRRLKIVRFEACPIIGIYEIRKLLMYHPHLKVEKRMHDGTIHNFDINDFDKRTMNITYHNSACTINDVMNKLCQHFLIKSVEFRNCPNISLVAVSYLSKKFPEIIFEQRTVIQDGQLHTLGLQLNP